jgi:hypothetical protein
MAKTKKRWINLDYNSPDGLTANDIPFSATISIKDVITSVSASPIITGPLLVNNNAGVSGQLLTSQGASAVPSWITASSFIGSTGVSGGIGATGVTGSTGVIGLTGSTGISGGVGSTGATGSIGLTGSTGISGGVGSTGIQGLVGSTGIIGLNGATGSNGLNGATGLTGSTGVSGLSGTIGINGLDGATGISGTNGLNGATGLSGSNGLDGATGISGTNGLNGATGITGEIGATGIQGLTGIDGLNGATGLTGATGGTASMVNYFPVSGGTITGKTIVNPSVTSGNLVEVMVNGVAKFYVDLTGAVSASTSFTAGNILSSTFAPVNNNSGMIIQHRTTNSATDMVSMVSGTITNASGTGSGVKIMPTYNQTTAGTAANRDLWINRTETTISSGGTLQRLISGGVGGASYVEKFGVDNKGNVLLGNGGVGTSATNVLSIANGTAPTTSISGVQLWSEATGLKFMTAGSTAVNTINTVVPITGGTMTGALIAQINTDYTVAQMRNIIESTGDPTGGNDGDVWLKYIP